MTVYKILKVHPTNTIKSINTFLKLINYLRYLANAISLKFDHLLLLYTTAML